MALFRRNKIWWTDFSSNGMRSPVAQHYRLARSVKRGEETHSPGTGRETLGNGTVVCAARFRRGRRVIFDTRKLELSERSLKKERQLLVQPARFFGGLAVARITTENLLAYRESRAKSGTGAAYVNMEMGSIRRILKRASAGTLSPKTFTH